MEGRTGKNRLKSTVSIYWMIILILLAPSILTAATYTVKNTDDSGPDSLREAIELANVNPGADLIVFSLPGPGPHTIQPLTALPKITDPVVIDGYTQPGAVPATYTHPATLLVELDGSNVGSNVGGTGLNIWLAGNTTIRGLAINRFRDVAIHIHEGGENVIEGNYIGTDITGMAGKGNFDHGIRIWDSPNNAIGGTTPAARNIISGNDHMGIQLLLPSCSGNIIRGNYIGTDAAGTGDLGNGDSGILMGEGVTNTTIGPGNVISGNGDSGIALSGNNESGNHLIVGNLIGTDVSGTMAMGNSYGIRLLGVNGNTVKDNVVSHNRIVGIAIGEYVGLTGDDNVVTRNTISDNGGFGLQIEWANNNLIYNNSFIDNHAGTPYQVVDHGGTGNVFNLPKPVGGNFWSEWTGPDVDGDGYVDMPYSIWTPEDPDSQYDNQDLLPWATQDSWHNGCFIQQLIAQVAELDLPKGTANSLNAKLENAAKKLDDQQLRPAINSLYAFINAVEAQRGKKIPEDDANALIAAALEIIAVLESM